MRRPPRLVRMLAPLCSFAGAVCLFYAFDIGAAQPINLGGGQIFIPEPAINNRPLAVIRSAQPELLNLGFLLFALAAVLWFWDAATSN